jgi:hypothetical protein
VDKNSKKHVFEEMINNAADDALVEVLASKKGCLTLKVNGNFAHSYYDPEKEAEKIITEGLKDKSVVFVLGLGLGYHLKKLLQVTDSVIVLIETSKSVLKAALKYDNSLFNKEKVLIYSGNGTNLAGFLADNLSEEDTLLPAIVKLPGLVNTFKEEYLEIADAVNLFITRKVQSRITAMGFGKKWITNSFKNFELLENAFVPGREVSNDNVYIIASGPSLGHKIPYIKLMSEKGVLICVSHSLNFLLKNDIIPDYVVAIDAGHALEKHFLYLDKEKLKKISLVTCLSANHRVVKNWPGKRIFVSIDMPFEKDVFVNTPFLPVAGTVSATAYYFALLLSSKHPCFAGLDLTFTNTEYHHRGSLAEEELFYKSNKLESVLTKVKKTINSFKTQKIKSSSGKVLTTNMAMASYRDYFDEAFIKNPAYILGKEGAFFKNALYVDFSFLNCAEAKTGSGKLEKLLTDKKRAVKKLKELKGSLDFKNRKNLLEEVYFYFLRYLKDEEIPWGLTEKFKKLCNFALSKTEE